MEKKSRIRPWRYLPLIALLVASVMVFLKYTSSVKVNLKIVHSDLITINEHVLGIVSCEFRHPKDNAVQVFHVLLDGLHQDAMRKYETGDEIELDFPTRFRIEDAGAFLASNHLVDDINTQIKDGLVQVVLATESESATN